MRILHLDCGREMHGGQIQALLLHRALIARGYNSVLLAPEHSPLLKQGADPLSLTRLPAMLRRFDIVHAHDARSHTLCALLSRISFVVSRRVAFPVRESMTSRWKYRQPAMFLAVSQFVRRQLMKAGVEDHRIKVVYDGVSLPDEPAHGDDVLVLDKINGKPIPNLEAAMKSARTLVYLSESEGLGSGILLAMAHGVPVIASDVGGIPEIVINGVTGVLVNNSAEAIANALERITPNMGVAARATVKARFTVDHMVQATIDAYLKVAAHA